MRPATRSRPEAAILALVLMAVPAVADVVYADTPDLVQEVRPSLRGATLTFHAAVKVETRGEAYLKVVPAPTNPAFANGTAESGWYTRIVLRGEGVDVRGESTGAEIVPIGWLEPNRTYDLDITVTVPPGALAQPREYQLRYAFAIQVGGATGSGGQLDPSLSVNPRIVVTPDAAAQDTFASRSSLAILAGLAALGVLLMGFARRRRQGDA